MKIYYFRIPHNNILLLMHAKKRLADLPFEFNKEKNRMDLIMINECFTILCSMEKKKI